MAVPKKHTSKSKTKIRKSVWKDKANKVALRALSLAKSILTNRSKSFYYAVNSSTDPLESVPTDRDSI
uniref:ribosomal protein L32 n=1 Tax=Pallavicinia lyellii TaxID=56939 RepID=UPI001D0FDE7C|nr:ribosomal protein L32 [Pallavicinia lyellii]QZZ24717.1 ribosomal protein L32 [Pallavicinia lyellii]QZZ24801.1 ribosomal protein L32 [Pallavicinia lyellii]